MKFLILFIAFSASPAFAYKGTISFTAEEKSAHAAKSKMIAESAANCLEAHYQDHVNFFNRYKVSKYFGSRRYLKGEVPGHRPDGAPLTPIRPELRKHGLDPNLEKLMTSISCVDLARICLREGFQVAGQLDYWQKIDAFNILNDNIGPIIQVGLQALGWKQVYWNPDPTQNSVWDAADRARTPGDPSHVWGYHQERYLSVMNKGRYYQYPVDDKTTLVGFKTQVPASFKRVPFFVGFAHTGYHVFLGTQGEVIEAHSVRDLFSLENIQLNPFGPLTHGAPLSTRSEVYLSGMIAVPPGSL